MHRVHGQAGGRIAMRASSCVLAWAGQPGMRAAWHRLAHAHWRQRRWPAQAPAQARRRPPLTRGRAAQLCSHPLELHRVLQRPYRAGVGARALQHSRGPGAGRGGEGVAGPAASIGTEAGGWGSQAGMFPAACTCSMPPSLRAAGCAPIPAPRRSSPLACATSCSACRSALTVASMARNVDLLPAAKIGQFGVGTKAACGRPAAPAGWAAGMAAGARRQSRRHRPPKRGGLPRLAVALVTLPHVRRAGTGGGSLVHLPRKLSLARMTSCSSMSTRSSRAQYRASLKHSSRACAVSRA